MRKRGTVLKTPVLLSVDHQLWIAFKAECNARKITASSLFEDLMRKRLDHWQKEKKTK